MYPINITLNVYGPHFGNHVPHLALLFANFNSNSNLNPATAIAIDTDTDTGVGDPK